MRPVSSVWRGRRPTLAPVSDDAQDGEAVRVEAEAEAWERAVDDPDLRGVDVQRMDHPDWTWEVFVSVAEFLREGPLEHELRTGVDAALRAVPGVTEVVEEDRELWLVRGDAAGPALVAAVGVVVDGLAERADAHLGGLDGD